MFAHPARTWSRTMSWTLIGTPFGPSGAGPLPPPPCRCMSSHSPRTRMPARGRPSTSVTRMAAALHASVADSYRSCSHHRMPHACPIKTTADTSCTGAWLLKQECLQLPNTKRLDFTPTLTGGGSLVTLARKCTYDERTLPLAQPLLLRAAVLPRPCSAAPLLLLLLGVKAARHTRGPAAGARHDAPGRRLHEEPGRGAEAEATRHEERRAHAEVGDHARRAHRGSAVAAKVDCLHGRCSHHVAARRTARPDLVEALKSSRRSDTTVYRTTRETC